MYSILLKGSKVQLINTEYIYFWTRDLVRACIHILKGLNFDGDRKKRGDEFLTLFFTSSVFFLRFTSVAPPLHLLHAAGFCDKEHPDC